VKRALVAATAAVLILSACGSDGGDTPEDRLDETPGPTATAETTEDVISDSTDAFDSLPPMPALEPITDPGTVDRKYGEFPIEQSRGIQYAWISYDDKAAEAIAEARRIDNVLVNGYNEEAGTEVSAAATSLISEAGLYYDLVWSCHRLQGNWRPGDTFDVLTDAYEDIIREQTGLGPRDGGRHPGGYAVMEAASTVMCPETEQWWKDDIRMPTPVMIRSILGVGDEALGDDEANQFANGVCNSLDRGDSASRVSTTIADKYDYPDETADELVEAIDDVVCG